MCSSFDGIMLTAFVAGMLGRCDSCFRPQVVSLICFALVVLILWCRYLSCLVSKRSFLPHGKR